MANEFTVSKETSNPVTYNSMPDTYAAAKKIIPLDTVATVETAEGTFNGDLTINQGNVVFKGQGAKTILTVS